jgi:hypothetical protein
MTDPMWCQMINAFLPLAMVIGGFAVFLFAFSLGRKRAIYCIAIKSKYALADLEVARKKLSLRVTP